MTLTRFENILAIDTATRKLNLALAFGGDRSVKASETTVKTHGQVLIKRIDDLMTNAGLEADRLQAIVVCRGPGSFTGLRIGLAAAKGIAVAGDIPIVGISLFAVAALRLTDVESPAHVLIPSRRGEFYVGSWDGSRIGPEDIRIVKEAGLVDLVGTEPVYGIGFDPQTAGLEMVFTPGGELEYDGADLLEVGRERLARGEVDDPAELEPIYLQKAIAEIRFDQKHRDN